MGSPLHVRYMSEKQDNYEMLDTSHRASFPYKWIYFLVPLLAVCFTIFYIVVLRKDQNSVSTAKVQASATPVPTSSSSPPLVSTPPVVPPSDLAATVNKTIYFNFDIAQISPSQLVKLKSFWSEIQGKRGALTVEGYSDDLGPLDYNQWLSTARAEAIVRSLQQSGINHQNYRVTVKGFGESRFVRQEQIERVRALNRKVVLTFYDSN